MKTFLPFVFILNLLLCGCYTHQPPYPRVIPIHECCSLQPEPTPIPIKNEANVRLPGHVKAYAVNRYIDPANPRIMHERHVVYRVEEDPTWRLASDNTQQILIGNTLTNGKLNYNPAILEKELALELQRQRLINKALESQSETLLDTSAALSQTHQKMQERASQIEAKLEKQTKLTQEMRDRMEL